MRLALAKSPSASATNLSRQIRSARLRRCLEVPRERTRSLKLQPHMRSIVLALCAAVIGLAGCSVPAAGPTTSQIVEQAAKEPRQFNMVEIDGRVVSTLASRPK